MKKKLEAELISIAHRVLKLKGKEDTLLLHQEAQKLYEKLSVLRFYEENFEALQATITPEALEAKMMPEPLPDTAVVSSAEHLKATPMPEEIDVEHEKILVGKVEITAAEVLEEETVNASNATVEAQEVEVAESEPVKTELETELPVAAPSVQKPPQAISLEELLGESYKEPEFVKVNEVPKEVVTATDIVFEKPAETPVATLIIEEPLVGRPLEEIKKEIAKEKSEYTATSLNEKFSKTINLGLNDRIAFEKNLFDGSSEDLNRVLSQLNTMTSLEEAQNFINDLVKPDYNNWQGKDEFSARFMELIEKKFA